MPVPTLSIKAYNCSLDRSGENVFATKALYTSYFASLTEYDYSARLLQPESIESLELPYSAFERKVNYIIASVGDGPKWCYFATVTGVTPGSCLLSLTFDGWATAALQSSSSFDLYLGGGFCTKTQKQLARYGGFPSLSVNPVYDVESVTKADNDVEDLLCDITFYADDNPDEKLSVLFMVPNWYRHAPSPELDTDVKKIGYTIREGLPIGAVYHSETHKKYYIESYDNVYLLPHDVYTWIIGNHGSGAMGKGPYDAYYFQSSSDPSSTIYGYILGGNQKSFDGRYTFNPRTDGRVIAFGNGKQYIVCDTAPYVQYIEHSYTIDPTTRYVGLSVFYKNELTDFTGSISLGQNIKAYTTTTTYQKIAQVIGLISTMGTIVSSGAIAFSGDYRALSGVTTGVGELYQGIQNLGRNGMSRPSKPGTAIEDVIEFRRTLEDGKYTFVCGYLARMVMIPANAEAIRMDLDRFGWEYAGVPCGPFHPGADVESPIFNLLTYETQYNYTYYKIEQAILLRDNQNVNSSFASQIESYLEERLRSGVRIWYDLPSDYLRFGRYKMV